MLGKIEYCSFSDLIVPYGGAFYIKSPINLKVHSIQLQNNVATSSNYVIDDQVGGSGFIFVGNDFYGSNICVFNLSTTFRASIFAYADQYNVIFNTSSLSCTRCLSLNVDIGKGNVISNGANITLSKSSNSISTIHFGWYPSFYYGENFIGYNNSGQTIFGHSSGVDTTEQKCQNIILVENEASKGIFGFWQNKHRIINSFLLHNKGSLLHKEHSEAVLTLEDCYSEDSTGVTVTKSKTFHETNIVIASSLCEILQQNAIYEKYKKLLNIRTCKYQRRLSYSLFFCLLQTSQ